MLKNLFTYLKDNSDSLFDTDESSRLIGKSKPWFERHRWSGTGPRFTRIGRKPYYSGENLLHFLEEGSHYSVCRNKNHKTSLRLGDGDL